MSKRLVLYLKSGQTAAGQLTRPFRPNDLDIEVRMDDDQRQHLFALDEICAVAFAQSPPWFDPDHPEGIEEIQLITGETFRVEVFPPGRCRLGFLGLLEDPAAECRSLFFTFSGIRCRTQDRKLGQILLAEQLLSEHQIAETLDNQNRLRSRRLGEVLSDTGELTPEQVEQAIQNPARKPAPGERVRVGDILVEAGLVTREQVEAAFASQQDGKKLKVGELLVSHGLITEEQLLKALAAKFRLRFVDLASLTPSAEALGALSAGLVDRLQVFPVELHDRTLVVATSAPTDPTIKDALRFSTGLYIEMIVTTEQQITAAIDSYYHGGQNVLDSLLSDLDVEAQAVAPEDDGEDAAMTAETDSTLIALVNRLLLDAYRQGASDLHFEPGAGKNPAVIRYRIDGECQVAHRISSVYKGAIVARLKIIAGLDITERRRPQSGKILLHYQNRKLEYRLEITPTVGNQEDVVLRLLNAAKPVPLNEMGLLSYNLERFQTLLEKPYGVILCVGPTGSGKTTTLHSALSQINSPKRKIWTVEDPVEITQPGLRQVQVNRKIGFGFPEALRSFLRADPDVIMVGEMRDVETAKIAIEASLTGHLVLSTLHTNSAPETVVRLIEMGMDPFNFSDALLGIIAQRLVRRLCSACREPVRPSQESYADLVSMFEGEFARHLDLLPRFEQATLMQRKGCEQCAGSGYRGRLALHELLLGSPAIKQAIRKGQAAEAIRQIALADGMWTLRMDGIMKIFAGETDLEQVNKVCL